MPTAPRKPMLGCALPCLIVGIGVGMFSDAINGDAESTAKAMIVGAVLGAIAGFLLDMVWWR